MNGIKPQRGIHRAYLMIVGGAALVAVFCCLRGHACRNLECGPECYRATLESRPSQAPRRSARPSATRRAAGPDRADRLPVPLVPLRRAGPSGRVELPSDHERKLERVRPSRGRRRIPDSVSGRRAERRRSGHCDVEPDERRDLGASDEHGGAVDIRIGRRRKQAPGKPWPVGRRSSRSPTRSSGSAATTRERTAARSRVRTTRTTRCATATSADPRAGGRAERSRQDVCDLEPDRSRRLWPTCSGSSVTVEGLKAAGDRLVVSSVKFSPNPVTRPDRPDHRARSRHEPRRQSGPRCARVHARDTKGRRGADGGDERTAG